MSIKEIIFDNSKFLPQNVLHVGSTIKVKNKQDYFYINSDNRWRDNQFGADQIIGVKNIIKVEDTKSLAKDQLGGYSETNTGYSLQPNDKLLVFDYPLGSQMVVQGYVRASQVEIWGSPLSHLYQAFKRVFTSRNEVKA